MNAIDRFDPFNDRFCRDVRNALAENFKTAIEKNDLQPVKRVAQAFLNDSPPPYVSDYIHRRLIAYEAVLAELVANTVADPLDTALVIWGQRLFFETHEYIEPYWMVAVGQKKLLFQALIRAAGTYVHLEQGNRSAARRMASKAVAGLIHLKDQLAVYTDPQALIDKLQALDPIPPCFTTGDKDDGPQ